MDFSIEHIGLPARDPLALKDWYVRVLGAVVVFDNRETPPAFLLRLPGGVLVEIYAAEKSLAETANNRLAGWRHAALRVDALETAQAELSRRGVRFQEPIKPAGGGGRVLFFADAEGNLLHLVERPPGWLGGGESSVVNAAAQPQP
jgi:glyoxylase I family protein